MSYKVFQKKVNALIKRAGGGISVSFRQTSEGRFSAYCSDGTEIIGNKGKMKVMVRWGGTSRGHQAIAEI